MFLGNQPLNYFIKPLMINREALFFALFYLALGCYYGLYEEKIGKVFKWEPSIKLILIFSLLQIVERGVLVFTRFDFVTQYRDSMAYWGEYFFTTIPLTISIFFYAIKNGDKFRNNFLVKVGQKSLGIYIVHMPVMGLMWALAYKFPFYQKFQIIYPLIVFVIVYGLILVYEKLKSRFLPKKLHPKLV